MKFNFHIIAHDVETGAEDLAKKLSVVLTDAGKVVDKIIYTDDNGVKELNPVIKAAADVVKDVAPVTAPVIDTVEKTATDAANDVAGVAGQVTADVSSAESTASTSGDNAAATEAASEAPNLIKEIEADAEKLIHDI